MRKLRNTLILLAAMNSLFIYRLCGSPFHNTLLTTLVAFPVMLVIALSFLTIQIIPRYEKAFPFRLQVLSGGYELILSALLALFVEIVGYVFMLFSCNSHLLQADSVSPALAFLFDNSTLIANAIIAYLILLLHYLNGFWRTALCSAQLGIGLRLLMFFFWWIPPINLILFFKWCKIVKREIITARNKYLLETARVENSVCKTRYPVVMVHGIFFRDWQYMNYWGRIPKALKQYGADVYYGKQQSSLSVADSAKELQEEVLHVLSVTGAEKVNIVAHSKGGLDARYAISKLGLSDKVASLTTINTPHRGCPFADALLQTTPNWLVHFVGKRYNALFRKLGDTSPNFLAGVHDLTVSACEEFNKEVTDAPNVYYQSVMSSMKNHRSAGFPLNFSYLMVKKYSGANDGLVGISSAPWGNFLGVLTAGKKGISHGDMIDLTHKDIKGFDVSEFYINLFEGLKKRGL